MYTNEAKTKDIINHYFERLGRDEVTIGKIRAQVDRSELYAYEQKLGKSIFTMNEDELLDMLTTFGSARDKKLSYNSYTLIIARLRDLFNFYIDNYKVIKNPFYSKKLKGRVVIERVAKDRKVFTQETMDTLIDDLHKDFCPDRAKYYELLINLFYDGISSPLELASIEESQIDYRDKTIVLPGRIIQLSDKTFALMKWMQDTDDMEAWRGKMLLTRWHDKYMKYITRPSQLDRLQDKTLVEASNIFNTSFSQNVRQRYKIDMTLRTFYLFGFYRYLVEKFGQEQTDALILSDRNSDAAQELLKCAAMYGINFYDNATILKKSLTVFVSIPE